MWTSAGEQLVLLLPNGARIPVDPPQTIGRAENASIRIADRTVSRMHARISFGPHGPTIEDAGSRFGTRLAGERLTGPTPLQPGAQIRLGNIVIRVAKATPTRPRLINVAADPGPGDTVVVPVDATLMGLRPAAYVPHGTGGESRPRVRSGWAMKRLSEEEGRARFVLQDLRSRVFVRMEPEDAALFELLDGNRNVAELLLEASRLVGPTGPGRLTRLVADLAHRGLIEGVSPMPVVTARRSLLQRLFRPRERLVAWVGDYFPRAYHRWGHLLFKPLSVTLFSLVSLAGFGAFAYLVGARHSTPFVVAHRLAIGGAVFIAGRFALVALHELAHGLALAHYGRRAARGGLRMLLIFPYAFVDTSEAYLEPRGRRMVISAAGPASDLTLGGAFSFTCAASPPGAMRDVLFQLAFGGYLGAFFNLNPFLDRDGYSILVDYLREPRLRQRARHQLAERLSGAGDTQTSSRVLGRYAIAGVIWSALGATLAVIFSSRYHESLSHVIPNGLILPMFIAVGILLFIPVLLQVGIPIARRVRFGSREVNRVIR